MNASTLDRWIPGDAASGTSRALADSVLEFAIAQGPAGFTAEEFRSYLGWTSVSPHLIAAAIGMLRSHGKLWILQRERSRHREAKGRWVSRFVAPSPLFEGGHG